MSYILLNINILFYLIHATIYLSFLGIYQPKQFFPCRNQFKWRQMKNSFNFNAKLYRTQFQMKFSIVLLSACDLYLPPSRVEHGAYETHAHSFTLSFPFLFLLIFFSFFLFRFPGDAAAASFFFIIRTQFTC